jgi:hypothetical protein
MFAHVHHSFAKNDRATNNKWLKLYDLQNGFHSEYHRLLALKVPALGSVSTANSDFRH